MPEFKYPKLVNHQKKFNNFRHVAKGMNMTKRVNKAINKKEHNKITSKCLPKGVDQMFPDELCVKFKNYWQISLAGNGGAAYAYASIGNGLHAALTAAGGITGANPIITNQDISVYGLPNVLSATSAFASTGPYLQYRVVSSAITYRIQNTSAAAADSGTLVIVPVTLASLNQFGNVNSLTQQQLSEMPYARTVAIAGTTINKGVTITHKMSTARMFALKYKSSLEDDQYAGTYGVNPTQLWYWLTFWYPQTGNNTPIFIVADQSYFVQFYNRTNLSLGHG